MNILTCGTAAWAAVYAPAPQHLAIAATFLVHPSTTTRAKTTEEHEAAGASLQLLRLTNQLIGPEAAKFNTAFAFTHFNSSRHGGRRREEESTTNRTIRDDDDAPLNLDLAQSGSLWSRAEDFWHVVGWAFNCSVLHPERWEHWQTWLDFMCDALEHDWEHRLKQLEGPMGISQPSTPSKRKEHTLKQSLIYKFLTSNVSHGSHRRVLRAIFADGSPSSVNEFREIFKNELKERKKDENNETPSKRRVEVNIDEDQYADYMSQDEDGSDEPDPPSRARPKRARRGSKPKVSAADSEYLRLINDTYSNGGVAAFGGFRSLEVRQRLLRILSEVSREIPKAYMKLEDLYHLFVENIRHLPLPAFQALVSPGTLPFFKPWSQSTLCEVLLYRMRESGAPESTEYYLTQTKLQECFLPYAANTASVVDNAKVSILLESLIVLLAESNLLHNTPELREAVETGNLNRVAKAEEEIRRNKNSRELEDVEWCWLIESGERLLYLTQDILPPEDWSDKEK